MTADRRSKIPTPLKIRVRRLVQGLPLQVIMFGCLCLVVSYLWTRHAQTPNTIGQAATRLVNVSATANGKLLPLYEISGGQWTEFDRVQKGQVVARLDDSALRAELAAFQQDTDNLRSQLASIEMDIVADHSKLSREHLIEGEDLARAIEETRLDILDRLAEMEEYKLELGRLELHVKLAERAAETGLMSAPGSLEQLKSMRDAQAQLVAAHAQAYRQAQINHQSALARRAAHPTIEEPQFDQVLAPLRAAVKAAEMRVEHMHAQLDTLEIRSPINGRITAVHCYPGQGLRTGEWIVTIAAEETDHIVAFIRPDQGVRPVPGSPVGVRLRMPSRTYALATTEQVGSQWEPLPEDLRQDLNIPELVLPVRVSIPPELHLAPGELVDITFFSDNRKGI